MVHAISIKLVERALAEPWHAHSHHISITAHTHTKHKEKTSKVAARRAMAPSEHLHFNGHTLSGNSSV